MIVLKHYSDLKTKLEVRKVKFSSGAKMTIWGQLGLDTRQMFQLGQYGAFLIKDRASKGIGSDDAPMKPLKEARQKLRYSKSQAKFVPYGAETGYKKQKVAAGGKPIRDLTLSGDMLGNISVRSVSATQARIDITKSKERMKARANEVRAPWWGWSPKDLAKLTMAAQQMFSGNLIGVGFGSGGGKAFGSSAVWMDPFTANFPGSRDAAWASGLRNRIATDTTFRRRRSR